MRIQDLGPSCELHTSLILLITQLLLILNNAIIQCINPIN